MNTFHIFLSSPSDCPAERAAIHQIVARLNGDPLLNRRTQIEVIAWDSDNGIPFDALESPQRSVDARLLRPEQCNLVIAIFRQRFGTPLPRSCGCKTDGQQFLSGTEYELHQAWDARRRGASQPEIYVYRWQVPTGSTPPDASQFEQLDAFFQNPPFRESIDNIGAYMGFVDTQDFAAQVKSHIRTALSQYQPGARKPFRVWLQDQAAQMTNAAGPRYTQAAHVDNDISHVFDWLLTRQAAISSFDKILADIYKYLPETSPFAQYKKVVEEIATHLRTAPTWKTLPDFARLRELIESLEIAAWEEQEKLEQAGKTNSTDHQAASNRFYQLGTNCISLRELLKDDVHFAEKRVLLMHGVAGQGKTHTLVHEINQILANGGIAIGVLGHMLTDSGSLLDAICDRLGWTGTPDQLLDELENQAARIGQRALIVVDALNETPNRKRWRSELINMVQMVQKRPHLALAISVREDYLTQVLPTLIKEDDAPWVAFEHPGFEGLEPEALAQYFAFFGVTAPVAPAIGELTNPLYAQLFVKSLLGRKFSHWQPSWLEVWQAWLERLEQEAKDKLELDDPSRPRPLHRTMRRLAQAMLDNDDFVITRNEAERIAHATTGRNDVISFLCSAGALLDWQDEDDEFIDFGYERLSNTFMAEQLLAKLFKGCSSQDKRLQTLRAALDVNGSLHPLVDFEDDEHPLTWHRAGLLGALCLAVPALTGTELPLLIQPVPDSDFWHERELTEAFTDSLYWRSKPTDFGVTEAELYALWKDRQNYYSREAETDDLVRFAMIPGHPLGMDYVLHPLLLQQESPGARDAIWSIHLPALWEQTDSNLRQLVVWASDAGLEGIASAVALPAARLLAWICTTSQRGLRRHAIQGLTRILVACPDCIAEFLPDFMAVNDAYVVEAVLVAVWGAVIDDKNPEVIAQAATLVYASQFPNKNARWCHVTIRHYARQIVETAFQRGHLQGIDLSVVQPPWRGDIDLDLVPDKQALAKLGKEHDLFTIIYSSTSKDFYRYKMGGNSGRPAFLSLPVPESNAPPRPFAVAGDNLGGHANPTVFDVPLMGRFVAWNCLALGWSAERFKGFDSGARTSGHSRIASEDRTERIGKKYQWISWYTLLAYMADNYQMRPDYDRQPLHYSSPAQLDLELFDPSRWLQITSKTHGRVSIDTNWKLASLPAWPTPELADMQHWIQSRSFDMSPLDLVSCVPPLPKSWGAGPWLRIAAEREWKTEFAPGHWALGRDFLADLWWQVYPMLIQTKDLSSLLARLQKKSIQTRMMGNGRIDSFRDWDTSLTQWPELEMDEDEGFCEANERGDNAWLPVAAKHLLGKCGHPDRRDEHAPVLLPTPSLFREWGLTLDLANRLVLHKGEVVFGLASGESGSEMLFARVEPLLALLKTAGYALVWIMHGERRAFQDLGGVKKDVSVWADYCGVGYLGENGFVRMGWVNKNIRT